MMTCMFLERSFPCGDFTLNGACGPASGPPLIFLHGITRCWQDYLTLMPALAIRWSATALDFRGHGRSDRAASYLVADHVRDVLAFLQAHVNEPAVLYGHSLGALAAAGAAAADPERVRAVILEDPPAEPLLKNIRKTVFHTLFSLLRSFGGQQRPVAEIARDLGDYLLPMPTGAPKTLNQVRDLVSIRFMAKSLKSFDPEALTPVIESRWLDGFDMENVFRGVKCPALLFRADETVGGMLARSEGERIAGLMADCTTIDWPGVGHLVHWLQPEAAAKYTIGFLESQ
jgi:pimeloyl-ACP methyl ester carboxylesterase